jgi:hypothetical protein
MHRYQISAPRTPGAEPTMLSTHARIDDARRAARELEHRRDLTRQDVRIEYADGRLVEYAGPSR